MMKATILLFAVLLSGVEAKARIGETPKEIEARYGKPIRENYCYDTNYSEERGNVYKKNGMEVYVVFYKGQSAREQYTRESNAPLANDLIQVLLRLNRGDGTWEPDSNPSDASRTDYITKPASLQWRLASWRHAFGKPQYLVITTLQYNGERLAVVDRAERAKAEKTLSGF